MNQTDAVDRAFQNFHKQHGRWNTWSVFYFGNIFSVFTVWYYLKEDVELIYPCLMAAFISFIWIVTGASIKRTSDSWIDVINDIENNGNNGNNGFKINTMFKEHKKEKKIPLIIIKSVLPWKWGEVTNLLISFGLVVGFISLVLPSHVNSKKEEKMIGNINIEFKGKRAKVRADLQFIDFQDTTVDIKGEFSAL